jgi:hypothetical protein
MLWGVDVNTQKDVGTGPARIPLWVWVVGIPVIGTALAMVFSMTVPLLFGGGGGH